VSRWDTFAALCGHLRAGLLGGVPPSCDPGIRWEHIVEASSHHFVTPALAWCVRDRTDIPSECRDYFAAALALNDERNQRLTKALVRIVAALNASGIEPTLLKGAARLVDGIYPAAKLRFLVDLDVLVAADLSAEAAAAVRRIGFDMETDAAVDPQFHHLPMLCDRDTGDGVEIHTKLTPAPYDAIIPTAWFIENADPFQLQQRRVRLPNATASLAHNVVHNQLQHRSYRWGQIELRQLLDLVMIRARHEHVIDWSELDRRFSSVGTGEVLATYLEFASVLFGQPAPRLSHAPRPRALATFRRTIERPAMRPLALLARIPVDYVLARRHDPFGLFKLVSPRTWSKAVWLIKTRLGHAKWR
jgi:hypothetical protein